MHEDEIRALNARMGEYEYNQIKLESKVGKLDREIANTQDLLIRMLTPVKGSLDLMQTSHDLMRKQLSSTQKQINKLFHIASKKREP